MNLRDVGSTELTLELARRMAVIDKVSELSSEALVQELQQRILTPELEMDIADLLSCDTRRKVICLWLPIDGVEGTLLWDSISEDGQKRIIAEHTAELVSRLRGVLDDLEV